MTDQTDKETIRHVLEIDNGVLSLAEGILAREKCATNRVNENKEPILDSLKKNGIETICVEYDGAGDSGQIGEITAHDKDGKIVDLAEEMLVKGFITEASSYQIVGGEWKYNTTRSSEDIPLKKALEDFVYDALQAHHSGWEINEGSQGELRVSLEGKTFVLEHTQYRTESTDFAYDL